MFYKSFQFNYFKISICNLVKYSNASGNKVILMDIFGISEIEAELLMTKHKIFYWKDPDQLIQSYNFCKKIGITNNELLECPVLLTSNPIKKIQHYKTLEEAGFEKINASRPKLLTKTPVLYGSWRTHSHDDGAVMKLYNHWSPYLMLSGLPIDSYWFVCGARSTGDIGAFASGLVLSGVLIEALEYLLFRATKYIRTQVCLIKEYGYMKPNANVCENFLSYLDPPIDKPKCLDKPLEILDLMSVGKIHKHILDDWLKIRLKATDDDLIKLFRIHKMIETKSFRIINENISLAESLGLDHKKILKCGYLLNNYPEYPKTVLKEFPNLAGMDMRKIMKNNPKLMMVAPEKILMIYGILKEFGIPDEYIRKKHQVFCMNTETLRFRLNELNKIPELKVLKTFPRVLNLVVHHQRAKSKLTFLQNLKLKCTSFNLLSNLTKNDACFDNHIKQGKDVNSKGEVYTFFSLFFDKSRAEVKEKIDRHPYFCYVSYVDIQATYDYLISVKYTKQNIFRCLWILLYPKTKIQKATKVLQKDTDLNFNRLSQWKKLHLILYQIEKEYHFTGDGIWNPESLDHAFSTPEDKTLE